MDINSNHVLATLLLAVICIAVTYFFTKKSVDKKIGKYKSTVAAIAVATQKLLVIEGKVKHAEMSFNTLDSETFALQNLKINADGIALTP